MPSLPRRTSFLGDRGPKPAPEKRRAYTVLQEAHMADEFGRSQFFEVGSEFTTTPSNAQAWISEGVIQEK